MIPVAPRRAWVAVAAISGLFSVPHPATASEIESNSIEGRTEAAIAEYRNAMRLQPDVPQGAELFSTCAACHGPLGLGEARRIRPRLAGQHYLYLLRQLDETADRMRPGMDGST